MTKALGTGIILAAEMRGLALGAWVEEALLSMLQSNQKAGQLFQHFHATACTDVTGFGLIGHLLEMLKSSDVCATLLLNRLPLLPGVFQVTFPLFTALHLYLIHSCFQSSASNEV